MFERAVSSLIKNSSKKCWANRVDAGNENSRVSPPMAADEFQQLLGRLHFTNGADLKVVASLYRRTLLTALGQVRVLRYTGLRWGDEDLAQLIKILPLCARLEALNLKGGHNRFTSEGARMLAELLVSRPARPVHHHRHHHLRRRSVPHLQTPQSTEDVDQARMLPSLRLLGAGCTPAGSDIPEVLLEDEGLQAACAARGISLQRDVPESEGRGLLEAQLEAHLIELSTIPDGAAHDEHVDEHVDEADVNVELQA